jgi:branched-chain amino acid transport system substrate-binding protein
MFLRALAAACLAALLLTPAPAAHAQDRAPYLIGAILSLSGGDAAPGLSAAAGLDVAVRHINATGGIAGHPLQVRVLDDGGSAEQAAQMLHRLIAESNVVAVVGPNLSATAQTVEPAANDAHVPLLSLAPAPAGEKPVLPWVFRFSVPERLPINLLVDYAKRHGLSRLSVIFPDTTYGHAAADLGTQLSTSAGLEIVDREQLANTPNADGEVLRAREKGTQALLAFADGYTAAMIAKSMSKVAPTLAALGDLPAANTEFLRGAGKSANEWRVASAKLAVPYLVPKSDPLYPAIADFVRLYRGDTKPDHFGGTARDALTMLADAMAAGGTDREKVRAALENGKPFVGVMGVYRMTATEHALADAEGLMLIQAHNGAWKTAN